MANIHPDVRPCGRCFISMCLPITRNIMVALVAIPNAIEKRIVSKDIPIIFIGTNWVPSTSPAVIARIMSCFGHCLFCCFCVVLTIVIPMRRSAIPISVVSRRIMVSWKYMIPHVDDSITEIPTKIGVYRASPNLVILFIARTFPVAQIIPEMNLYRFIS